MAATLPLLLIPLLGRPELSWASLAGFNTILVDKGGAYRTRAVSMWAYAAVGATVIFVGTLAANRPLAALPLVLVAVTAFGMLRLFGAAATSIGVSSSVALVVVLALPAPLDWHAALGRAAFSWAGSAWAMTFSLLLWPIRPYRPARLSVASVYRELAAYSDHLADVGAGDPLDPEAQSRAHDRATAVRAAIENGRATLAALRRGRPGTSVRGEQLVVLLEGADQLFGDLVAMKSILDRGSADGREAVRDAARRIAIGLRSLAEAVETEAQNRPPETDVPPVTGNRASVPPEDPSDNARVLRRALDQLSELGQTAGDLDGREPETPPEGAPAPELLYSRAPRLALLRAQLTTDSAISRHALRVSITTAAAVLLTSALHLHRGYWTTLTCLVILQPHGSQTLSKALQRVGGTVVGAWIAFVAATWIHDPMAILGCVFVLIAIAVALMPINYGFFALFLTPSFVLLAERSSGEPGLASVRVMNTLLGAVIALLGSRLLFPLSERDLLRPRMAAALRTLSTLFDATASSAPAATLKAARRDVGLALSNADASFQRALTEFSPTAQENEALAALLLYSHRLADGLNAVLRGGDPMVFRALARYAPAIRGALEDLADAVERDRAVIALPELDDLPEGFASDLAVEHAAVARWHAARHA